MNNNKLLLFLPASALWARTLRRVIVIAVITFISVILKDMIIPVAPAIWVPILAGLLAGLDKLFRELTLR